MSRRAPPAPLHPRREEEEEEEEERDDNYDDTPLQHQKPFGAGFQRRQKSPLSAPSTPRPRRRKLRRPLSAGRGAATTAAASRSLSSSSTRAPVPPSVLLGEEEEEEEEPAAGLCSVCGLTLDDGNGAPGKHEASIAHQVCLAHSHPPSALDRRRMGFRHLASRGWDADARLGLGAQGAGILNPLQPRQKVDKGGIGLPASVAQAREAAKKQREEKRKKLSVKEMRKLQAEEKKKAAWLHDMFYAKDDVLKHLGAGTGTLKSR
ncbi:unnamed protein product [Parascedosporium putredinis]|uniref:G-patch domain-containing protein n=1 Tax=Parascedosporium putredinis TaxID=1442378 RepID=A0A9P1GXI5_9PEZI|nr:unnamed protein product [Parascedosporium putredinis]CAI7990634.1 unnamed protein product [Parascedosporium putredinis]